MWSYHLYGADPLYVEGSPNTVHQSLFPPEMIVEHDLREDPDWPILSTMRFDMY